MNFPTLERRDVIIDFITISSMANLTVSFEDIIGDYFNCTDANKTLQIKIGLKYNRYGFGPDDNDYYHAIDGPCGCG